MHNVMARMIIPPKHPIKIIMVLFRNTTDGNAELGTKEVFVKVLVLWCVINFDDGLHIKASEKER